MFDQIPKTPTDAELIEVLSAISIVALRLAKLLMAAPSRMRLDTPIQASHYTCPLYQKRRASHEIV